MLLHYYGEWIHQVIVLQVFLASAQSLQRNFSYQLLANNRVLPQLIAGNLVREADWGRYWTNNQRKNQYKNLFGIAV